MLVKLMINLICDIILQFKITFQIR